MSIWRASALLFIGGLMDLTQARLKEVLSYEIATGEFSWLISSGKAKVGKTAGTTDKWQGRRVIIIDKVKYKAHRLAWLYVYGKWPSGMLDHINGDPKDNRIENLRECSHAENMQNHSSSGYGKSGYLGVTADRGKWKASICKDGKTRNLGRFDSPEAAHDAYSKAKEELHLFNPKARK